MSYFEDWIEPKIMSTPFDKQFKKEMTTNDWVFGQLMMLSPKLLVEILNNTGITSVKHEDMIRDIMKKVIQKYSISDKQKAVLVRAIITPPK